TTKLTGACAPRVCAATWKYTDCATIRTQLIEFTADSLARAANSPSANNAFTSAWHASKSPSTSATCTLDAPDVVMNLRCTSEILPFGVSTKRSTRSHSFNACTVAPPVSPDVAQITLRR